MPFIYWILPRLSGLAYYNVINSVFINNKHLFHSYGDWELQDQWSVRLGFSFGNARGMQMLAVFSHGRWTKKTSLFEKGFNPPPFFFTRSKPNYIPQTICHNSQTHHVNWRNKIILIVVEIIFLLDNLLKHPFCHSLSFTLQPILMNFIYFGELFHLL